MNFFYDQKQARTKSRKLLFLFYITVVVIGFITATILYSLVTNTSSIAIVFTDAEFWQYTGWITLGIAAALCFHSWLSIKNLKADPNEICRSLGAVKASTLENNAKVKQYQNIVTEMSIASGVPTPHIYVLQDDAINAFACGYDINSAAVCVTTGCMNRLSRDELQAVVAHEFSHILNGDMNINLKLIALLSGLVIFFETGRVFLRIRGGDKNPLPLVGLGLMAFGGLGYLGGIFLKAAISRQREYLADASSVQFTRNTDGISGALKKIMVNSSEGYIDDPRAAKANHMFLVSGVESYFSLATHPPLEKRIQAIEPSFKENIFMAMEAENLREEMQRLESQSLEPSKTTATKPPIEWQAQLDKLTPLFLMFLEKQQLDNFVLGLLKKDAEGFDNLDFDEIEILLEQATGPLRDLSSEAKAKLLDAMQGEITKDGKVSFYEFLIYVYLRPVLKGTPLQPRKLNRKQQTEVLNVIRSFFYYLDDNEQCPLDQFDEDFKLIAKDDLSHLYVAKHIELLRFAQIEVKEQAVSDLKKMALLNDTISKKEKAVFRLLCQLFSVPGCILDETASAPE